jgi:hypothetical protein
MQTLDTPVSLHYNNGKVFPPNALMIGYAFLGVSLIAFLFQPIIGGILLILGAFICFTNYGTEINPEEKKITEYTRYFGFIRIGKSYSYDKHHFIAVIPTKNSVTAYSRSSSSATYTDYYSSICLLNINYRNKKELTKFESKSTAAEITKNLAHRMDLEYFEYDPHVIRQAFTRRR